MSGDKPKCPDCEREIDGLRHAQEALTEYQFYLENDEPEYSTSDIIDAWDSEWQCPYCYHLITVDEEEATKFLKGELEAI